MELIGKNKLSLKIEEKRKELDNIIKNTGFKPGNIISAELLIKSRELDELVLQYYAES